MSDSLEPPSASTYTTLLQQTYDEALSNNELNTNYWAKVKEEYNTLHSHLEVLPNDLSKDVMVPVGRKALMKGKMVHTNEILVCLGDGWFVKQSAKKASEICKRRIDMCNDMLKKLENERSLLTSRKELPFAEEAFGNAEGREILEMYDEKEESEWRVQHRQKEKEYRKKLAELRKKEKVEVKTEEDLWKRLDDLELQEELEEELDRLHADNSGEEDYDDDGQEEEEEENYEGCKLDTSEDKGDELAVTISVPVELEKGKSIFNPENNNKNYKAEENNNQEIKKQTQNIDNSRNGLLLKENCNLNDHLNEGSETKSHNNQKTKTLTRRVSFKSNPIIEHHIDSDNESEDPLRIEFKHSSFTPVKAKTEVENFSLQNPADIYNQFAKTCCQNFAPKSILKRSSSNSDIRGNINWHIEADSINSENNIVCSAEMAANHDMPIAVQINVVEHDSNANVNLESSLQSRPISRFRAARSQKR